MAAFLIAIHSRVFQVEPLLFLSRAIHLVLPWSSFAMCLPTLDPLLDYLLPLSIGIKYVHTIPYSIGITLINEFGSTSFYHTLFCVSQSQSSFCNWFPSLSSKKEMNEQHMYKLCPCAVSVIEVACKWKKYHWILETFSMFFQS